MEDSSNNNINLKDLHIANAARKNKIRQDKINLDILNYIHNLTNDELKYINLSDDFEILHQTISENQNIEESEYNTYFEIFVKEVNNELEKRGLIRKNLPKLAKAVLVKTEPVKPEPVMTLKELREIQKLNPPPSKAGQKPLTNICTIKEMKEANAINEEVIAKKCRNSECAHEIKIYFIRDFSTEKEKGYAPIYKFGIAPKRTIIDRLRNYKNKEFICCWKCKDDAGIELIIKKIFPKLFIPAKGTEYFTGNKDMMMKEIDEIILKYDK